MNLAHGIREVRKQREATGDCLVIIPIEPELAEQILYAVQEVAAAEPSDQTTWSGINLESFQQMSSKHSKQWEADYHRRKKGGFLDKLLHAHGSDAMNTIEVPFYKYQRGGLHLHMKAGHKIRELCADVFKNRTTRPGYIHERNTFPSLPETDNVPPLYSIRLELITKQYRYGANNASFGVTARYYSREYRAELLRNTGLVTYEQAMGILDLIYVADGKEILYQPNQLDWNLGASLHGPEAWRAKTLIIALACLASFRGGMLWDMFRQVMVQGGWPWLRGLPKAYVRLNFLAMISIFGAMRHGAVFPNTGELLMQLASRLVGDVSGPSTWIVREKEYLDDAKVVVALPIPPNLQNKKNEQVSELPTPWTLKDGTEVMEPLPEPVLDAGVAGDTAARERALEAGIAKSNGTTDIPVASATMTEQASALEKPLPPVEKQEPHPAFVELPANEPAPALAPDPKPEAFEKSTMKSSNDIVVSVKESIETEVHLLPLPSHIIPGAKCNHPVTVPFSGRLKLAHSLKDIESMTESRESIVVADTRNITSARNEVIEWLCEKRMMAVYRGEEWCVSCAYRLCHATGGFVIIC